MNKLEILGWLFSGPNIKFAWSHTYKNLIMDLENKITKKAILKIKNDAPYSDFIPTDFLKRILNDF
jgi:hypothetical protein